MNQHSMPVKPRPIQQLGLIISLLIAVPVPVSAHSADRGFILLLPTGYYVAGGTLAVLGSIVIVSIINRSVVNSLSNCHWSVDLPAWFSLPSLTLVVSLSGSLVLAGLVVLGFSGSSDPLNNPLPLTIWTIWWVVITLLHAVLGNLWAGLNPWSGIVRLFRLNRYSPLPLPEGLGYWPAIIGMFSFAWFELISLSPEDPPTLASAILGYWLINFLAILVFGEDQWLNRGEAFSVFFRFISRLSPLALRQTDSGHSSMSVGLPGHRLMNQRAIHWSGAVFILLTLASVSFDGLNKTFWWLHLHSINPLAFEGRSSVTTVNSLGLILAVSVLVALYGLSVWTGWRLSNRSVSLTTMFGQYALTIIPISLAYHFSHYLTQILVNGQYAIKVVTRSDLVVTTSFLSNHHAVEKLWQVQTAAIVIGHIVSVIVLHQSAHSFHRNADQALRNQLPLALLMVLYTTFGLWLLAAPAI